MKRFICGVFEEEERVFRSVKAARERNLPITDVFTPYAVHGLDEAMGIRRSRLPWVCFGAGLFGGTFALGFQSWTLAKSWPMVIGGKPFLAIPAFIPVTFELTVLLGGLATVGAFFLRAKLFPGKRSHLLDLNVTDDRFIVAMEQCDADLDPEAVKAFFKNQGAVEVFEKEIPA